MSTRQSQLPETLHLPYVTYKSDGDLFHRTELLDPVAPVRPISKLHPGRTVGGVSFGDRTPYHAIDESQLEMLALHALALAADVQLIAAQPMRLKVTIELVPNGDDERTKLLGELTISNTGVPSAGAGNYDTVLLEYHRGRDGQDVSKFRTVASIRGLEREILRPVQLVGAALSLLAPIKRTMHSSSDPYGVVHSREEL